MAEEKPKFDARLAEGVAYFEQMLEIMPDDRTTLEFLVVAYEQLNEHEKGQKALVSLAKLLIKEHDIAALEGLLPRLQASDYDPAKVLALRVARMTAPTPDLVPEEPREISESERAIQQMREAVQAEKALATQLREGGVLTAEEERNLHAHIESIPLDGRIFLISAIHILEKENSTLCEKAMEFLADHFGAPPIPLVSFDVNRELVQKVPSFAVRIRGVVPFAKLGGLTLAATLNPADEKLRKAVETVAGPCRFFLAEPSAVEAAVARVYGDTEGGM